MHDILGPAGEGYVFPTVVIRGDHKFHPDADRHVQPVHLRDEAEVRPDAGGRAGLHCQGSVHLVVDVRVDLVVVAPLLQPVSGR